jgi:hypothetical protein
VKKKHAQLLNALQSAQGLGGKFLPPSDRQQAEHQLHAA